MLFTVAGFALGWGAAASGWLHAGTKFLTAGLYGMSIASTIWSVTHKPKLDMSMPDDFSTDSGGKFDTVVNDISSSAVIPVIYGTRKWGGLQTWHNPHNSQRNLEKDVVVCEGGIKGIYNVCANDDIIKSDTNVSIYNTQYEDATVRWKWRGRSNGYLILEAGGTYHEYLCEDVEAQNQNTGLLATIIENIRNEAGDGWKIDGAVNDKTSKGINANNIKFKNTVGVNCYCDPSNPDRTNMLVLDDRGYSMGTYTVNDCVTPSNYEEVGGYPNLCWIRADLIASGRLSGGNPTINGIVQGKKVKVWKDNAWVVDYSENPAWIIRDFLTSKRYGCGYWITEEMLDDNSFKEVAGYCDELVNYIDENGKIKNVKRYTLNIPLSSKKKPLDWLADMFACSATWITINKKIALHIEKAENPVYSFTDDTIVKDSMSITQTSVEETPNRYKIGYTEPSQGWTEVKVVVEDIEAQIIRNNRIVEKEVGLSGCTSQQQALRLGRLYRDLNKTCSLTIAFSVATQGMLLEAGDVIQVTYGGIFKNMLFRITEIEETNTGTYQLVCRQYNKSIYNDKLGATISIPKYGLKNSPYVKTPPVVSNLVGYESSYTSEDGRLIVALGLSWDDLIYEFLDHYRVTLSNDNGKTYKTYVSTFENNAIVTGIPTGRWLACVQAVTKDGIVGVPKIVAVTLLGKDAPPADVGIIDSEELASGVRRFWWKFNYPKPNDIIGFKLKYTQGSNPNWDNAYELHTGFITAQPFETAALRDGVHTVMIKAVDNAGYESVNPSFCVLNLGEPLQDNIIYKHDCSANNWSGVTHNGVIVGNTIQSSAIGAPIDIYIPIQPLSFGQFWINHEILNASATIKYCLYNGALAWTKPTNKMWALATNKMWQFSGIYKPYTGKVMINSTDTAHIIMHIEPDAGKKAILKKFIVNVDVPDRTESFTNLVVPTTGVVLPIVTPNYYTTAVHVGTLQSSTAGNLELEVMTKIPCKIRVNKVSADGTKTPVSAVADVTWQGFIKDTLW